MKELFGIPMTTIMIILIVMLFICLLSTIYVAIRKPVIFKLGVRNIPRRKAQTTLIVVGLMLATLIISAALGTGDTLNNSVNSAVYQQLGPVDEVVVQSNSGDGEGTVSSIFTTTVPESSVETVRAIVEPTGNVDAVGGVLFSQGPAVNTGEAAATNITSFAEIQDSAIGTYPNVTFAGVNQQTISDLGGIKVNGGGDVDLDALGPNEIYINEGAADELNAKTGDTLVFSLQNQVYSATVKGVLPNSAMTGAVSGSNDPGILLPLSQLQTMTGQEGQVSFVGISNKGGDRDGLKYSDDVTEVLEPALADQNLGVVALKADNVELAELIANVFVTFFVIFGLFSIGVGILLIVLIFTMLAAERRAEMGMERAVGAQRRQLVQQFIAEGAGYALLSGLVGTALGVGAAFAISQAFKGFIGDEFNITPYVSWKSLVIAYCLGVVITFLAVAISSWRVSRLNIVSAVRDIPDAYQAKRNRKQLIWSIIMIIGGGLLTYWGKSIDLQAPFSIGMTLIPFGIAALLAYFGLSTRLVMTLAGVYTLGFWLLPPKLWTKLFGDDMTGDIDMFFVSGVCIVAASTLVIVQNLDAILGVAERIGSIAKNKLASIRLAVSYPGASKSRTGMTIAMFSLIVFSLVMVASINENFAAAFLGDDANAGWEVEAAVSKSNPIDDFSGTLQSSGFDMSQVDSIGRVDLPYFGANQILSKEAEPNDAEWVDYNISVMDNTYIDDSSLEFQARANGYDSDAAINEALKTQPDVMVIDSFSTEDAQGGFGGSIASFSGVPMDGSFEAPTAKIRTNDGEKTVKIIGVVDSKYSSLVGAYMGAETGKTVFPNAGAHEVVYYLDLADGASAKTVSDQVELKLLPYGVVGTDLKQQLIDDQSTQQSFMYILQGFMGLGLIVGIAAVGVIAFRSVVERRQQIGMMRAMGFQKGMISQSFVFESAIIVILGVVAGAAFGLILAWQLMTSDDFTDGASAAGGFIVPWPTIIVTLSAAVIAALFMAWLPARQAASVAPAEALRYE